MKSCIAPIVHRERLIEEALGGLEQGGVRSSRPSNLTCLTFSNYPDKTPLEISFDLLGIDSLVVLGKTLSPWPSNLAKIDLALEYLTTQNVSTEYTMWIDSRDAVLIDDLSKVISVFEESKSEVLFSSTAWFYPDCDDLKIKFVEIARDVSTPFLNSGVVIGKTNHLINLLHEAWKISNEVISKAYPGCDQAVFSRLFIDHYPQVKIDYSQHLAFRPAKDSKIMV